MNIFIVGGTFNEDGGRASGYIEKLTVALRQAMPDVALRHVNGGYYQDLAQLLQQLNDTTHLLWMADVPNTLPKLLPALKQRMPALTLIQSKNNRQGKYSRVELYARMRASRSEFMLEFTSDAEGLLAVSLLTVSEHLLLDRCTDIRVLAAELAERMTQLRTLCFPLRTRAHLTTDSESYAHRDFNHETEIPLGTHPGAFGTVRRCHIHEGVDLYGQPGAPVYAMEAGVVVARQAFTGEAAGSPWWADTECLLVEGECGVLNYGEIQPLSALKPGVPVIAGQLIGHLVTVLRKDKGRPRTMLHLERYVKGTCAPLAEWRLLRPQPGMLCDPTSLLVNAQGRVPA